MNKLMLLFSFFICSTVIPFCLTAQDENESTQDAPEFNAELAKELGADDYGMRSYVFCVLKTGKATVDDEEKRKELLSDI